MAAIDMALNQHDTWANKHEILQPNSATTHRHVAPAGPLEGEESLPSISQPIETQRRCGIEPGIVLLVPCVKLGVVQNSCPTKKKTLDRSSILFPKARV